MAHTHRVARYVQLLRADPKRTAPEPARVSSAAVREWKMQIRAFDEAKLRLKLATPASVQRTNSALRIRPSQLRVVRFASYA